MHVYRYRPWNLLTQKELRYDEWYFASREELNDPMDMQSKFEFSDKSEGIWLRAIRRFLGGHTWGEVAADYFSSICPMSYEKLLSEYHLHSSNVADSIAKTHTLSFHDMRGISDFLEEFKAMLSLYAPNAGYSISLSGCNDEMLMWSHYAGSHSGYCLIYRPIAGFLNQCPERTKNSLSVSPSHTTAIGKGFRVAAITYANELASIDAFSLLPGIYTGYEFKTEKERLDFHDNIRQQLLTKNECWAYEKEYRLLLPQPSRYVSGKSAYSNYQRLFHYDFNQVVGIVFGSRMKESEKADIKEIINEKLQKRARASGGNSAKTYIFDFLYQQAEICSSSRAVRVVDEEMISMGTPLKIGSEYYDRRLASWKAFGGTTVESGRFSHEPIP
ncbi:DUF2971 domain-containing protein [Pusillimonas sp.]|uniref:DUF2971 domain-containing protein n=1 Tax=Pusillimonas sp. TaxID=3040095 RepID=UPI0037CC8C5F